jgi:hypothetical protein
VAAERQSSKYIFNFMDIIHAKLRRNGIELCGSIRWEVWFRSAPFRTIAKPVGGVAFNNQNTGRCLAFENVSQLR